jgi:hypothetical protein
MDFIIGAGIFFVGLVVGYGLKDDNSEERISTLESEMDSLQDEFAPAVARSIQAMAVDIKQLSDNDGELINAYQSVSSRLSTWVTESQSKE